MTKSGLMASMAKINVMSIIAMEDAVFTETNISGEMESGQYRKGRFAKLSCSWYTSI